ncbi:flagellar protein FlgN [Dendrosporobacter sp. 1207_IL3150]|uniref:flagellar protein FlgN n=1 Tax=Dendrosporobacter sp. 1207_IL3150 TaxID=3084054 RepID=UPI002FD9FFC0
MWEQLVTVLTNMLKLYQALLTISKQKHEILVAAKAQELEAITKQEELLIIQIGKLETNREQVLQEILTANKITDENINVSRLAECTDEVMGKRIKDLWQEFDKVTVELVRLNELNTRLIEQALSYINYNVNLLTQASTGPTYAAKGQQPQNATNRAVFDQKI